MLTKYIQAAMNQATYEIVSDGGSFYGQIPGLRGVWASAKSLEACRNELEEVLEDWILVRISEHLPILEPPPASDCRLLAP